MSIGYYFSPELCELWELVTATLIFLFYVQIHSVLRNFVTYSQNSNSNYFNGKWTVFYMARFYYTFEYSPEALEALYTTCSSHTCLCKHFFLCAYIRVHNGVFFGVFFLHILPGFVCLISVSCVSLLVLM